MTTDLQPRLEALLDEAADAVAVPVVIEGYPQALARRRQRRRRTRRRALVAVAAVAAAVMAVAIGTPVVQPPHPTEAAGPRDVDGDGVPVDTGPELSWREVDGPPIDPGSSWSATVAWSGERFVTLSEDGAVLTSTGGETWVSSPGATPEGFRPGSVTATGGKLVAWGSIVDSADQPPALVEPGDPVEILVSDDHGDSWYPIGRIEPDRAPGPEDPVSLRPWVRSVVAVEEHLVVSVSVDAIVDLSLLTGDPTMTDLAPMTEGSTDFASGEISVRYCPTPLVDYGSCPEERVETKFTSERLRRLAERTDELGYQTWVAADGGPLELVDNAPVSHGWVASTGRQLAALSLPGFSEQPVDSTSSLRTSVDGRTWSPRPAPADLRSLHGGEGWLLGLGGGDGGDTLHLSRDATTWEAVPYPVIPGDFAIGPGGVIGTGVVPVEPNSVVDELVSWLGSLGRRDEPTGDDFPSVMVGWSADGQRWGWQSTEQAFGHDGWPAITSGADRAVAVLMPFGGTGETTTPRWFVADLPAP